MDEPGKMHFRRMDEGTDADFAVLARVHEENIRKLPALVMGLLTNLRGDEAYPVDRLEHSLQAATRAVRDGRDEEYVVCALLHDIGEALGPFNHGEVAAAVLKPFVSEANHWMLEHHPVFQIYFYGRHLGVDPDQRERYRGQPYFDRTAEFCALYDEISFDPDYRSEPMAAFEPMVRRVLDKRWTPPSVNAAPSRAATTPRPLDPLRGPVHYRAAAAESQRTSEGGTEHHGSRAEGPGGHRRRGEQGTGAGLRRGAGGRRGQGGHVQPDEGRPRERRRRRFATRPAPTS